MGAPMSEPLVRDDDASWPAIRAARIEIVKAYFRKVDRRDPSVLLLFTDDVQLFFPKFGTARGSKALADFSERVARQLTELEHDIDAFLYTAEGDRLVVEGTESGRLWDGAQWPDGKISQGRFCSVFEFDGELIGRMHIYVDPDFGNQDRERLAIYRRV